MGKGENKAIGSYMIGGILLGFVIDMFYGSAGGPGFNTKLANCDALKWGDLLQIGSATGVHLVSMFGNSWRLTAFTGGAVLGNLIPKILEASGQARYGVFDFDPSTGTIKAKGGGLRSIGSK